MKKTFIATFLIMLTAITSLADLTIYRVLPMKHPHRGRTQEMALKLKTGDLLADFEVADLAGNSLKSSDLRKNKILVLRFSQSRLLNFEAPPEGDNDDITKEFPQLFKMSQTKLLNQAAEEYPTDIIVLDIITKDKEDNKKLIERCNELKVAFTIATDPEGKVADMFGVKAIPAVLIFDKEGKLYASGQTIMVYKDLKDTIEEIKQKSGAQK